MEIFLPVFLAACIHMMKPGPFILAITGLAISGKWKSIFVFWLSYITAGTVSYFVFLGGLSLIPQSFGLVFIFLKAAAAMIFMSLGIQGLSNDLSINSEDINQTKEKIDAPNIIKITLAAGFMALSNPFDIVLILGVIPALTEATHFTIPEILMIRGTTLLANITVLIAYCLPLVYLRKVLTHKRIKTIRFVASIMMICIGIYILLNMFLQWDLYETGMLG